MTGALSSLLGVILPSASGTPTIGGTGPGQVGGTSDFTNPSDPGAPLDFNPIDYLYNQPDYQSAQNLPTGAGIDPTTGAATTPSAGTQSDSSGSNILSNLPFLRNLFTGPAGSSGGTPGIQRTPDVTPTGAGWITPSGAPGQLDQRFNAAFPNMPQPAQAPSVPLPQPRPAAADAATFDQRFQPVAAPSPAPAAAPSDAVQAATGLPAGPITTTPTPSVATGTAMIDPTTGLPVDISGGSMPELMTPAIAGLNKLVSQPAVPQAEAAVGPVQAGQTSPLHEPAADVPMESGISSADPAPSREPAAKSEQPPPASERGPEPGPSYPPEQPYQPEPITPLEIFKRIGPQAIEMGLLGGPMGLAMSLPFLAAKLAAGNRGGGGYGQQPRWLTPEEYSTYRRTGRFPSSASATKKPQFSKNFGEQSPKRIAATRENPPASPVNLPGTAGAIPLDPATSAAASGPMDSGSDRGSESPVTDANFGNYARQLGQLESGGDPSQRTGSNMGIYQFGPREAQELGINPWDPQSAERGLRMETARNIRVFQQQLGRTPTASDLYLMHQQGIAGGPALIHAAEANPNMPAWQVIRPFYRTPNLAGRAIHDNVLDDNPLKRVPVGEITAGEFVRMWRERFNRGYAGAA